MPGCGAQWRHTGGSHQKSRPSRSEEKEGPGERERDLKDPINVNGDRFVYNFIIDFCLCVKLPACITICNVF